MSNDHSLVHGRDRFCPLVLKYPDVQLHISDPNCESELAGQGVHTLSPRLAYEPAAQAVWIMRKISSH